MFRETTCFFVSANLNDLHPAESTLVSTIRNFILISTHNWVSVAVATMPRRRYPGPPGINRCTNRNVYLATSSRHHSPLLAIALPRILLPINLSNYLATNCHESPLNQMITNHHGHKPQFLMVMNRYDWWSIWLMIMNHYKPPISHLLAAVESSQPWTVAQCHH